MKSCKRSFDLSSYPCTHKERKVLSFHSNQNDKYYDFKTKRIPCPGIRFYRDYALQTNVNLNDQKKVSMFCVTNVYIWCKLLKKTLIYGFLVFPSLWFCKLSFLHVGILLDWIWFKGQGNHTKAHSMLYVALFLVLLCIT